MKSALLLAAAICAGGCKANDDAALSILQMEALTTGNNCVAMPAVGAEREFGVLDVNQVQLQGYLAFPLVRNNEVSRVPAAGSAELNSIQVIGANVSLDIPPALQSKVPEAHRKFFYSAAAGRIDPSNLTPMVVEVVPVNVVNDLASTVQAASSFVTLVANVSPVGMQNNDRVIGGPISFPVNLCFGCIKSPSPPACPFPMGTTVATGGCVEWQDDPTDCCRDSTGQVLCGAAAPVATMTSM